MKYSFCVSSSGDRDSAAVRSRAYQLGAAIAASGQTLVVATTTGTAFAAAQGAKAAGGLSIGFSPATSLREHIRKYRLPAGPFDHINFTGMSYAARDLQLVLGCDAVLSVGPGSGLLPEIALALETDIIFAVLETSRGQADLIREIVNNFDPDSLGKRAIFATDPKALVKKVVAALMATENDLSAAEIDAHNQGFEETTAK